MEIDLNLRNKVIWHLWEDEGYTTEMIAKVFGYSIHKVKLIINCMSMAEKDSIAFKELD